MVDDNEIRTEKGLSLARGPALVLGTILLAAGLYLIYKQHAFPKFANFPDGKAPVDGKVLFGIFGANGWTGMFTAIGGGLLLFGAAQHLLAKTMSLIVGVAFGAAAIIAASSGDVLGLAAANGWTEIGWGIAAAILLFNTLVPRRRRTVVADTGYRAGERTVPGSRSRGVGTGAAVGTGAVAGAGAGALAEHEHDRHRERVDERDRVADGERVDERDRVADGERVDERDRVADGERVDERDRVAGGGEPPTERQAVADRETPGETRRET